MAELLCDRRGRRFVPNWHQHKRVRVHFQQLEAWYRTLDQLVAAKEKIEVALYHHLRDLFSFKPDLGNFSISPGGGLRKVAVPGQLAREFQG